MNSTHAFTANPAKPRECRLCGRTEAAHREGVRARAGEALEDASHDLHIEAQS